MLILALESSAKPASVALCSGGELLGQYFQNNGLTHSRTLLAMAESLLKNLGISISDIDLIAVSKGPGSFTGVRIGVSAAKGLAWGADKPVCGVSTLEAMAYQAPEPGTLICAVMDARRNQVYNALFTWENAKLTRQCEDRAISLPDLADELHKSPWGLHRAGLTREGEEFEISPHTEILLVGDGAAISREQLSASGIPCRIAPGLTRYQTAYGVALAAENTSPISAQELEPCYLRPSQAEREHQQKIIS